MYKFLLHLATCMWVAAAHAQSTKPLVSLEHMREVLNQKTAVVIDIREPQEHATGVAKGAKLIAMSSLGRRLNELPKPADKEFYLVCNTQNRSARVVEQLQSMGYKNVKYVHGGMSEWVRRGWEVVPPSK